MKKQLISASLKLVPKMIQNKAMVKAFNYLFCNKTELAHYSGLKIMLKLTDINHAWSLMFTDQGFVTATQGQEDVTCMFPSDLAFQAGSKESLVKALEQGDIKFIGSSDHIEMGEMLLLNIEPARFEALNKHLKSFLRIKPFSH
jgi:ubiquinone biosynthesis protein UbiJ